MSHRKEKIGTDRVIDNSRLGAGPRRLGTIFAPGANPAQSRDVARPQQAPSRPSPPLSAGEVATEPPTSISIWRASKRAGFAHLGRGEDRQALTDHIQRVPWLSVRLLQADLRVGSRRIQ